MKNFFNRITLLMFFLNCIVGLKAQLDNNRTKTKGNKVKFVNPITKGDGKKPVSYDFDNEEGFKTAHKKLKRKQKQQKENQDFENKGILTKEMIANRRAKKNIEGNFKNFPMIDMDLGSFHTKSKYVLISSLDFGVFDGDKVQITVNGERIHNNYLLTQRVKTIKIPLPVGINKIEVTALNEGELSPNTGYFVFYDDQRQVVKEGKWMLATGAKVIAIMVRDE